MKANRHITAYQCRQGCLWLHDHDACPDCGGLLDPVRLPSTAIIVTDTIVRVNPSGRPIHLGVARTASGAATLCVVHGRLRGNGRDRVRLRVLGGRYHAFAPGYRLERDQSQSSATRQSRRL